MSHSQNEEQRNVNLQDYAAGSDQFGQPCAAKSGNSTANAPTGGILITNHLWFSWLKIAIERAGEACRIREKLKYAMASGENFADLISSEFESAIVAIAGSAHALDALYGSSVIPQNVRNKWPDYQDPCKKGPTRPAKIRESLKYAFETGPKNTPWVKEFGWLFGLRDAAVHAAEKPKPPQLHPIAGHTSEENAKYTIEAAERAVTFALSVFRWCVDNPRPISQEWATSVAPMIAQLEEDWSNHC